jgi:lysozyme
MSDLLPHARPEMGRIAALELLTAVGVENFALIGRRGYYADTMGTPGVNDLGVYDDAMLLVTPTRYATFNANTDPSRQLPGIATLKPGVWLYKLGIHGLSHPVGPRQYPALVQAAPVTVTRDGGKEDTGYLGINIHHGGEGSTSSEGCQTIPPSQWPEFYALVKAEMTKYARRTIPYALTVHA